MPPREGGSLWDLIAPAAASDQRFIADAETRVAIRDLRHGSSLGESAEALRGRSVMISTERQLPAVLALAELDGVARRVVICTPDLSPAHVLSSLEDAEVDVLVSDGSGPAAGVPHQRPQVICHDRILDTPHSPRRDVATEWVLFTSGTTGRPKLALHSLQSLVGPLSDGLAAGVPRVWSTFYDVRRYGGLQILFRALVGGGSMVLSDAHQSVGEFLRRVGAETVTHISGTPSHWRRALMSAKADRIAPDYVRLSGEACDQAILDSLRHAYPTSQIAHAFASTEAGVAFDVRDGLAGFPASLIGDGNGPIDMRVEDGSLRIRSSRAAARYLGEAAPTLVGENGFLDTGDLVELRGGRYYFVGRRGGVINVGGLKVHPEVVEAVINQHPAVSMSRVSARPSPITGAIVVAEVVVGGEIDPDKGGRFNTIKGEIVSMCQERLPAHQVPIILKQVASLEVAASGKLVRPRA